MKFEPFILALAAVPAFAARLSTLANVRRDTDTCKITLTPSNGGRKLAVVLDSSGSMLDNDPNDLRIAAGKALNKQFVSAGAATQGKTADEVAVVDFDFSAAVVYPLGDPAGADSSFDSIDSSGGTWIADGVDKALTELTKPGHGETKQRSGIIVLTDGEDSDISGLIEKIDAAGSQGIRVSFGFLAAPESFFQPELLEAILRTGGTYMSFDQAENIEPWLFLLLGNGITDSDQASSADQPLLSGITVAKLTGSDDASFSYAASAGEKLVFTVASLSQQALNVELKHEDGGEITKNATTEGETDPTELTFEADKSETLQLVVSSADDTEGVFQISVNSSLGISGCNLNQTTPPRNETRPPTNGTYPTPLPTLPTPTAGASTLVSLSTSMMMLLMVLFLV